jgi:hypothetical protein
MHPRCKAVHTTVKSYKRASATRVHPYRMLPSLDVAIIAGKVKLLELVARGSESTRGCGALCLCGGIKGGWLTGNGSIHVMFVL